ncbi:hypothetical protein D9M72_653440 [compost metagenome]
MAGAEIGVHGALAILGKEDHRAGGEGAVLEAGGGIVDTDRVEIAFEHVAQRVIGHLADESRAAAQGGDARRRVGGAAARDLLSP